LASDHEQQGNEAGLFQMPAVEQSEHAAVELLQGRPAKAVPDFTRAFAPYQGGAQVVSPVVFLGAVCVAGKRHELTQVAAELGTLVFLQGIFDSLQSLSC
jgi:hypothetical protein